MACGGIALRAWVNWVCTCSHTCAARCSGSGKPKTTARRCKLFCTWAWLWGSSAITGMPKATKRGNSRAERPSSTKSGLSRTKASSDTSSMPPSLGKANTLAGQLAKRSVPTKRLQAPKAQTLSAKAGIKVTMR